MSYSYSSVPDEDAGEVNQIYLDVEGSDVFGRLEFELDQYFNDPNEKLKIVTQRRAVADKIFKNAKVMNDARVVAYVDLIATEVQLLEMIRVLKEPLPFFMRHHKENAQLVKDAREEFQTSVFSVANLLEAIVVKIIKSPSATVAKDVKLLNDIAQGIATFSNHPTNENNMKDLIANTQLVHKKMGTYWRPLKAALTALVGLSLILVGALSLVPSFGASVALIATGSALCAASGLSLFKPFVPQKAKTANEATKELLDMLTKAKKLLTFNSSKQEELLPAAKNRGVGYHKN